MGDWIKVNLFFAGMAATAAGLFLVFFSLIRAAHFSSGTERSLVGCSAVATLVLTALIWRAIHRRIDRGKRRS